MFFHSWGRVLQEPAQEDWDIPTMVVSDEDKVRWAIETILNFAGSFAYGYIPLAWRALRVIFIPKPGRDSYELAKTFRPISLTSLFLKTMERLVDSNIRAGQLKSFPLMESQYAYQRGRSTEGALHDLVQKIESKGVCSGRVSGYRWSI
jgi:hypothetical protein